MVWIVKIGHPADVADFKRSWTQNPSVTIKGHLQEKAKRWCRENCYRDFIIKSLLQDDTKIIAVHFRRAEDAFIFKMTFSG